MGLQHVEDVRRTKDAQIEVRRRRIPKRRQQGVHRRVEVHGWYRAEMGKDVYNMESHDCSWATPDPVFVRTLRERSARSGA